MIFVLVSANDDALMKKDLRLRCNAEKLPVRGERASLNSTRICKSSIKIVLQKSPT